jgi:hypothetical protein
MVSIVLGLLKLLMGFASKQGDNATSVALEKLRSEVEMHRTQAEGAKARLGHPVAWFPEFLASMGAVVYLLAHIIDTIWQLPGDIAPLDAPTAAVVSTIFASMFFSSKLR